MYYKTLSFYKYKSQEKQLSKIREILLSNFQWTNHTIPKTQSYITHYNISQKNHSLYDSGLHIIQNNSNNQANQFRIQSLNGTLSDQPSNQMVYKFTLSFSQTNPLQFLSLLGFQNTRVIYQNASETFFSLKYGVQVTFLLRWKYIRICQISELPLSEDPQYENSMTRLIFQLIKDYVSFNAGIDYMNMLPDDCKSPNQKQEKRFKLS